MSVHRVLIRYLRTCLSQGLFFVAAELDTCIIVAARSLSGSPCGPYQIPTVETVSADNLVVFAWSHVIRDRKSGLASQRALLDGFQRDGVVSILKDGKTSFKIILGEVAGVLLVVVGTKLLERHAWR